MAFFVSFFEAQPALAKKVNEIPFKAVCTSMLMDGIEPPANRNDLLVSYAYGSMVVTHVNHILDITSK